MSPRHELAIEGHILLVEDEEAVLEFERDVLTGAGAEVVTVMDVEDVQARMQQESFGAVIINGKMPGGWGAVEFYRWIAEKHPGMEKHLLFTFSGVADQETRAFLKQHQLPSLVKPFEVADLISHARKLLQKTQAAVAG